ncbi:Peptidyl-prolyl cis-trans isomerase (rotamase)-cyclophilin family [Rheinheimera pacifica]|uniref:Peptidyl-prolyl cis-trans isomerase n=1 Tax=Rheinheimera pacifica TaxID=173990 RepID=A0A1H6K7N3_9GAMM|nr:peptidylprolyl isomerase [Rheinheimera pacifica]SEH67802.1 Peptidyl-prolyl cis-trans isomerase (rotamase)-cyclophilin family [Rheinheimera pacifica]
MKRKLIKTAGAALALLCSTASYATIVEVTTNVGKFEINLFDQTTPVTVQNFLSYVNAGRYNGTVFHRSVPGFVVQGGGFTFDKQLPLKAVATFSPIVNEPKWSNVRATVAMAKQSNNPNSATNQWFINLANNSGGSPRLDTQNSGFTVFGQITAQGMEVVDAIAGLQRFTFPGISDLPLRNYSSSDRDDNKPLVASNLVTIESIVVVDARVNTVAGLNPVANTSAGGGNNNGDGGSSGSFGWLSLLAGMLLVARRRLR